MTREEAIALAIKALKQKREVLNKLRAELHATAEMHEDGGYYIRDEWIDEYFDKYKGESIAKIDNQPTVNMDFKEITLNYKGMTRSALYDPHREMIFTDYMTTEYAKSMGYTWKEAVTNIEDSVKLLSNNITLNLSKRPGRLCIICGTKKDVYVSSYGICLCKNCIRECFPYANIVYRG